MRIRPRSSCRDRHSAHRYQGQAACRYHRAEEPDHPARSAARLHRARTGDAAARLQRSGFKYGRAISAIEAVIACTGVPMTIVELGLWKKFHGLRGGDKESG